MIPKELFVKHVSVKAILTHCRHCGAFQKKMKNIMLKMPKVRNIVRDPNGAKDMRLVLLQEDVRLTEEDSKFIDEVGGTITDFQLELGYDHFNSQEVLKRLLPSTIEEIPSHFETIGHVAHFNLREEHLPHKDLIGKVIIDKNRHVRTVVHKTSSIATEFRTFPMEVIAGKDDLDVMVNESGCRFKFNFREVYWNSRLQHEHLRIVKGLKPSTDEVVCDMMAGIGPFAVPAAKKGCKVFANDLNPCSHKYLVENIRLNKLGKNIKAYNMDGRDFVRSLRAEGKVFTQVFMNLPALGIEFLDVFVDGCMDDWPDDFEMPLVHTYCFSKSADPEKDVQERVAKVLGHDPIANGNGSVRQVRDVAPNKLMMCAEFRLPRTPIRANKRKPSDQPDKDDAKKAKSGKE
eukprot:g4409.t1